MTQAGGSTRLALSGPRAQQALPQQPFHEWRFEDGTLWLQFFRQGGDYLLRFPYLADFNVGASGHEVAASPVPGVDEATVQHLYLNQVLPLALSRQSKLVLHGSAVETAGGCIAFVGSSGRGKSTLAASFAASGHRFLTDDGLQLEWHGGELTAVAGHPSVRLWEDSRESLVAPLHATAPPVQYTSKARFLASPDLPFCADPRRVRAILFLGTGEAGAITLGRMSSTRALLELVRHSFLLDIDEQQMLASHFDEISRIANLPIHYHLDYPRRFEELASLREAVLQAVQGDS